MEMCDCGAKKDIERFLTGGSEVWGQISITVVFVDFRLFKVQRNSSFYFAVLY